MDQHRLDERAREIARELIERGEFNHLLEQVNAEHRIGQGIGQRNGNRDRYDRQYDKRKGDLDILLETFLSLKEKEMLCHIPT